MRLDLHDFRSIVCDPSPKTLDLFVNLNPKPETLKTAFRRSRVEGFGVLGFGVQDPGVLGLGFWGSVVQSSRQGAFRMFRSGDFGSVWVSGLRG